MADISGIREAIEEGFEKVRGQVDATRERLEKSADRLHAKGEEAWKDAETFVRRHPAQSLGLALLVGVLFGSILNGRRRD